jgi:dolichyl-diphosphooligosaccharide--protein glycosyltransferase
MRIKEILSKEHVVNGLKSLGKLRIKISHGSIMTFSALLIVLFIAFTIRIFPIKWEIQAGGNTLHLTEFDPYFQYHVAQHLVTNGFIWTSWNDPQRWYPYGINVGASAYPGLPMTGAFLYEIISLLGVNIGLMDFCAILPPIMGTLACLALYFLGKDLGGKSIGIIAALFLALDPSYISRSNLGWFDDELVTILSMILIIIFFLRAIDENRSALSSVGYSIASGLSLAYLCAGSGSQYYPIGATVLFVAALILFKRYTQRLLWSYSLTFGLSFFVAINVPRLSPTYLTSSAIVPVAVVFLVLCFFEVFRVLTTARLKWTFIIIFLALLIGGFVVMWHLGYMQSVAGKFLSVIDPYMRSGSVLFESVAEQSIAAWSSIYFDYGIAIIFFIAGFYFVLRNLNNRNLFLVILGLTSLYFACTAVRLLVLLAPFFGLLVAFGIMGILKPFTTFLKEPPKIVTKKKYSLEHVGREFSVTAIFLIFLILTTRLAFVPQSGGVPSVYGQAYTPVTLLAGSLSLAPSTPVTAWVNTLQWLRNLPSSTTTVVCSWWDYGNWLYMLGNVTVLCDNGTNNSTQIGLVGRVYMSNETQAVRILKEQFNGPKGPPKYILIFLTFWSSGQDGGYGGDEGKWTWMARIANSSTYVKDLYYPEWPKWEYRERGANNTFGYTNTTTGAFIWNAVGQNTTFYKLMENAKSSQISGYTAPTLTYFKNPEYFVNTVGSTTTSSGTTAYLYAAVCLFEIDYAAYDSSH